MTRDKLYQELGLEPLRYRRWYRKLCLFYKGFYKTKRTSQYLFNFIPVRHSSHTSRNVHIIPIFNAKHIFLKNFFFSSTLSE